MMQINIKTVLIILAIFLMIGVVVGVLFFNNQDNSKSSSSVNLNSSNKSPIEADSRVGNVSNLNNKTNGSLDEKINKTEAIFIAHLRRGDLAFLAGPWELNASLTSDGKYWKVTEFEDDEFAKATVTINAETGKSKRDNPDDFGDDGTWKSFNEIKAQYICGFLANEDYKSGDCTAGKTILVTINGEKIWKTPIYKYDYELSPCFDHYNYFNSQTGQIKMGNGKWLTPKEVDDWVYEEHKTKRQLKNALTYLYPE